MSDEFNPHETELKTLQEERNTLAAKIRELAERKDEQFEQENWDRLNSDYDELVVRMDETIQKQTRDREIQERLAAIEAKDKEERGGRRIGVDHESRVEGNAVIKRERIEQRKETWLQGNMIFASGKGKLEQKHHDAARAVGVAYSREFDIPWQRQAPGPMWSGMRGGYTNGVEHRNLETAGEPEIIPEGFSNELEKALQAYGGPRSVARVLRTATGNTLPWPTWDDTGNAAAILAEETTIGASVDPTISVVTFNAYKYSSGVVLVSSELMTDSAFNLSTELGQALGIRIGRGLGAAFTTGTGSSQPRGLITATLAGGTTVDDAGTTIAPDNIITLAHSVDPAYRNDGGNVGYMMHDLIVAVVRKLKDTTNQYLWQPSVQAGVPDMLFGYPITINQHMDSTVVNLNETILFGNFSRYIVRDAGPMRARVLNERYADTDQVAFITLSRHDGDSIQDSAFAVNQQTT